MFDIHGNLPALNKVLGTETEEDYMNRYKCMVSPHFKQMTLLKAFLLDEIEICYSNMISGN